MGKNWYEEPGSSQDVAAASRIRLFRNRADIAFPWKLSQEDAGKATDEMLETLRERVPELSGAEPLRMSAVTKPQMQALYEQAILHKGTMKNPERAGVLISPDRSVSVTVNSEDHIRMQISHTGMEFKKIWSQISLLDDHINEVYPYAFDDVLGYRTTFLTTVGTGMKAYAVLHLPVLAASPAFSELPGNIGRYGLSIRHAFGRTKEECGDLYVIFNQKTLGISELDILHIMGDAISQLMDQERAMRKESADKHRLEVQDVCCKAYGTLRYARLMSQRTAMQLLSQLWWGSDENIVTFAGKPDFYGIMMEIQPYTLEQRAGHPLAGTDLDRERAAYLRERLPKLTEE